MTDNLLCFIRGRWEIALIFLIFSSEIDELNKLKSSYNTSLSDFSVKMDKYNNQHQYQLIEDLLNKFSIFCQ